MASMDSAFGGSAEGGFEPDDFYESFLAPKFHDFTAPEEPIDPDSYFLSKPGMLKKAFLIEEVKTVAPKIHKIQVAAQETLKMTSVVSQQQQQAPPRSPVAAEKTVRVGIAKNTTLLSSPLKCKILKNGSSNSNSPAQHQHQQHQLPMLEKSLKPTSLAKKLQASENDDPNSPLVTTKPALTRQRSQKATHEAEKPTLTRQHSQKNLEATKPGVVPQTDSSDSSNNNNNSEKESDQGRGALLLKKEQLKPAVVVSKPEHSATCKTPVKESVQIHHHPDVKRCTEITGSPFNGHHCKHARCVANDPNSASPVPTKKYLVAKKGTPGSIRKATSSHSGDDVPSETCEDSKESIESKDSKKAKESEESEESSDGVVECGVPKAKGHGQVSLTDAFNKMALEQSVVETQITMQVTVTTTEVHMEEEKRQSLTAENIRDWSRNSVNCEEKSASSSTLEIGGTKSGRDSDPNPSGVALFLQVASDCLETIDLNKLDVPPTKKVAGKKRKTGELVSAGASKKANCAAGENNKAVARKAKDAAASSKAAKMKLKRLSVARRLSVVRSRPGVTNPRPFRLRTQERGAVKEKEFMKKLEEHKAAQEGFNSAFQGLAVAEPKVPGKFLKSGHVFSATRAEPKDDKEVMKPTLVAHKAPHFDHPFKPHRSTKKLTVPQEPKFHAVRGSRNCPSHMLVPAA